MDNYRVAPSSTFALEVHCLCIGCKKKIKEVLQKARGVQSSNIDENKMTVTISGKADPHLIIAALDKYGKKSELMWERKNTTTVPQPLPLPLPQARGYLQMLPQALQMAPQALQMAPQALQFAKAQGSKVLSFITETIQPSHSTNAHEYELKNFQKRFTCNGCKEEGFGPRYRCKHSDYELHKECRFPNPKISHEFLKGSTLEFFDRLPSKNPSGCCIACGRNICGYVYHDKAKGWNLHPCCSNLKPKLCNSNDSSVIFILHEKASSKCMWCNRKKVGGGRGGDTRIPGWSYISSCKRYEFHVHCVTEMVHEAWKEGLMDNIDCMDLEEKIDLKLLHKPRKNDGKGGKVVWKIVRIFLKTIVGILLGDPTAIVSSVLVELISK